MSDSALGKLAEKVGAKGKHESQEWKVRAGEMMAGKLPRAKVDQAMVKKLLAKK